MGFRIVRFGNEEVVRTAERSAVVGKIREAIQFVDLFTRSHTQARKAGLTEEDIRSAVEKARKR